MGISTCCAGAIGAPIDRAGVKIVSDYVYNYEQGLPSEMAILSLFDPATGMPRAILDAAGITDMRTGAVTAVGAKYLARKDSQRAGAYRGAGQCLLERAAAGQPVRFRRNPGALQAAPRARMRSPSELTQDLGKPVIGTDNWQRRRWSAQTSWWRRRGCWSRSRC